MKKQINYINEFTKQLTNEKIKFSVNSQEKNITITPNNDDQYHYFTNHFNYVLLIDFKHLRLEFDHIPHFNQITWSGLIPISK